MTTRTREDFGIQDWRSEEPFLQRERTLPQREEVGEHGSGVAINILSIPLIDYFRGRKRLPLPLGFSLYLDAIRFLAAAGVCLHHLYQHSPDSLLKSALTPFRPIGQSCVIIFFVLSGFVIAHVTTTKEHSLFRYSIARISRIWSVVVLGLVITAALDLVGMSVAPSRSEYLDAAKQIYTPAMTYTFSLFGINEWHFFGAIDAGLTPGTNRPYWSLSFEIAYYLAAGMLLYAPLCVGVIVAACLLAMAGDTIAILFPLWCAGFGLYLSMARIRAHAFNAVTLFWVSLVVLLASMAVYGQLPEQFFGHRFLWSSVNFSRKVLSDWLVGCAFLLHLCAVIKLMGERAVFHPMLSNALVRQLGLITFPLYVFHFPMIICWSAIVGHLGISPWWNLFSLPMIFLMVLLTTPLCERLKFFIRDRMQGLEA